MGLLNPYLVKTVIGEEDLLIKADPGESFLIKDILIYNPAADYLTLMIDRTTVGYFRVGGPLGSHLPFFPGRSSPLMPIHAHTALTLLDTDGVRESASGDDMQVLRDGAGGTIDTAEVCTGGAASGAKTATIPTSEDVAIGGPSPQIGQKSLLSYMINSGIMTGYPVAVGESFLISGVKQAGAIQVVIYERYDEEDMKSEMLNGSKAAEFIFVNYGNAGADITSATSTLYDTSKNPAEFPDFPFGKVVPAKTKIDILSILASDFAPLENDDTDQIWTEYIKMIAERVTLFDEDRNGLLLLGPAGANIGGRNRVGEGQSLIGNYSDIDSRLPLDIPEGLAYAAGDELQVYLTTAIAAAGKTIDIYEGEIAFIEKVSRGE